ncbi:hypothetical protein SAMN05720469_14021, partial [Fibrobacter intestinalis]
MGTDAETEQGRPSRERPFQDYNALISSGVRPVR